MPKQISKKDVSTILHHFNNLQATQTLSKTALYKALSKQYGYSERTIFCIIKAAEPENIRKYNLVRKG